MIKFTNIYFTAINYCGETHKQSNALLYDYSSITWTCEEDCDNFLCSTLNEEMLLFRSVKSTLLLSE